MKLIAGLGNPGKEYEKTRHNVGFMVLNNFLEKNNLVLDKKKFNGTYLKTKYLGEQVIFAKPLTYMNNSGEFIANLAAYFNVSINDILIIVDDKDQLFGKYKLKSDSSSGGHNGLKSIINLLGSKEFYRLKIGIGQPKTNQKTSDFVLSKFNKEELLELENNMNNFKIIIDNFIEKG